VASEVAQKMKLPAELKVSTNKEYQLLMVPIFNQQMGHWYEKLGTQIDLTLRKNCSKFLKATLLYFFLRHFDISKEIFKLRQFYEKYK
jgi:hypothetical protein